MLQASKENTESETKSDRTAERLAASEIPRDGEDTRVEVVVVEGTEESRGHVKRALGAPGAHVNNLGLLLLTVLLDDVSNGKY